LKQTQFHFGTISGLDIFKFRDSVSGQSGFDWCWSYLQ